MAFNVSPIMLTFNYDLLIPPISQTLITNPVIKHSLCEVLCGFHRVWGLAGLHMILQRLSVREVKTFPDL